MTPNKPNKKILSLILTSVFFVLFSVSLVSAANRYVDDTGGVDTPSCLVQANPCLTINYAISQSNPGDTINVKAGTYDEQIVIDKSLTLQGAGDTTIIKPSSAGKLTTIYTLGTQAGALWNGMKLASIISVSNADNVIIKDLKVDGESMTSLPAGANYVVGVSYGETSGTVSNVKVVNMNKIPESIRTYGMWLDAVSNSVSVEVKNSNIELYNKNGINARGATLTINMHDNTVTGPDSAITQYTNGMGIVSGATGTVAKNTVTKIYAGGTEYTATGIFTYDTSGVTIEDNTISESLTGIALSGTPTTGGTSGSTVQRNIVFNCDVGIQLETPNTANNIINYNTIHDNNEEAIYLSGSQPWPESPQYTGYQAGEGNEAHFNKIYSNLQGIKNNNPDVIFNAENNWWGSNSGPGPVGPGSGDKVSINVDYDPWLRLELTVLSPTENAVYDSRKISINILTGDMMADRIEYSDNGGTFRLLCSDCNGYNKEKTFREGAHTLIFRAKLGEETSDPVTVNFFIDSHKPKIIKTLPDDGAIIHGTEFYVKYTEANLIGVSLWWKLSTASTYTEVPLAGCASGSYKECTKDLDMNPYDGEKINYYFEITDKANTKVQSAVKTITIDSTNPTVTINPIDAFNPSTKIDLQVNVDETVKTLEYSVDGGNFLRLCRDCSSYIGSKTFTNGLHTLVVRATDYVGNQGQDDAEFTVDTKSPKIVNQLPRNNKFTNGAFSVTYNEENLIDVTLFYKKVTDTTWQSSVKTTCESGRRKECSFNVNLATLNGQQINYYFKLRNHFDTTTGKTYTVNVDTTSPALTISLPVNGVTYSTRVPFDIKITNEKVKLEFSDNGGTFRTLCSNCDSYDRIKTFGVGDHSVIIRAADKAGNFVEQPVAFTVVTS